MKFHYPQYKKIYLEHFTHCNETTADISRREAELVEITRIFQISQFTREGSRKRIFEEQSEDEIKS